MVVEKLRRPREVVRKVFLVSMVKKHEELGTVVYRVRGVSRTDMDVMKVTMSAMSCHG